MMKFILFALFICLVSGLTITKPPKLPAGVRVINSVNASYPSNNDLSSFDSLARRAEIFGIGEDAHGVSGYQNFQFRLSKYLISNFNYRRVLHELVSDDKELNEYLLTGQGDLRTILYNNPWQNSDKETFDFFTWIRSFNILHPNDPVTVNTVDPQSPWLDAPVIKQFLEAYDAEYNQTFSTTLYPTILNNCFGATFSDQIEWAFSNETTAYYQCGCLPDAKTNACVRSTTYLEDVIDAEAKDLNKDFGKTFVGNAKYALRSIRAWQTKSALLYATNINDARQSIRFREVAFGLNVLWKAQRDNKRGKSILIAHNVHLTKKTVLATFSNANNDIFYNIHGVGRILEQNLGNKYVAVSQTGYNVSAMFAGAYPIPTSPLSIDVTLKALNQSYLLVDTNAKWVKQQGLWLQHEEGVRNGRYYELSEAFDRVMFHSVAPRAIFVNPTLPTVTPTSSISISSSDFVRRALVREH